MEDKINIYVGSYTNFNILAHLPDNKITGQGIYCFEFDTGILKLKNIISSENPAVLSFHPIHKNKIYSISESIKENGLITGYKIDKNIRIFTKIYSYGKSTCYFKIDPKTLKYGISINYWEGSLDLFKLNKEGEILNHIKHIDHNKLSLKQSRRQVKNREDHWVNRQVGAHTHSIHYWGNKVYIPDLGENTIFQYKFNPYSENQDKILEYETQILLKDGCGPRHMVFSKQSNSAYVSNELNSSICILKLNNNIMTPCQYINSYDKEKFKNITNYVAEIAMSNDEKFIYVSNRGVDIISIFKILSNGKLKYINDVSTYGKTPRHFAITQDNKYIISANQDSNNIIVFKRNIDTGLLTYFSKYENENFNAPNYVLL